MVARTESGKTPAVDTLFEDLLGGNFLNLIASHQARQLTSLQGRHEDHEVHLLSDKFRTRCEDCPSAFSESSMRRLRSFLTRSSW